MQKPLAVLNIEDSEGDSDSITRLLKKAGYKITFERVETAEQMLSALKKRAWDIIISDHSLPQFDSYAALALLREEGLDIPFIAVSGVIGEETAAAIMKAGAHDYLMIDNLTRLVAVIERELEQAKIRGENKRVEQELRDSEERFRELADNIEEVFWITESVSQKEQYVSPAYEKVWGRFLKDIDDFVESVSPEDQPIVLAALEKQKRGEKTEIEYRIEHADGSTHWVWDRAFPIFGASGKVKNVAGIATDITARKQAHEAVRHNRDLLLALSRAAQSIQRARTPEEIYRAVGEQIKGLGFDATILTLDNDGKHLMVNYTTFAAQVIHAGEKLAGFSLRDYRMPISPESIYGRMIASQKAEYIHSADDLVAEALPKALRRLGGQLTRVLKIEQGIIAPLHVDNTALGMLTIGGSGLSEEDVPAIEAFAAQVAISLQNVRLAQQAQEELTARKQAEEGLRESEQKYRSLYVMAERREQERALLENVRKVLAHELDLPTILRTVVEAIKETFGYVLVSLYLLRDETLILQHQTGYSHVINEIPITQGVAGRVARSGLPLLIEDVSADRRFLGAIDNIVSGACVPLFYKDQTIGILNVESTQNTKLSEADLNLMIALSEHISPAIGRARLYTEIGENEKRFRAMIENGLDDISLLAADGTLIWESPSVVRNLDYTPNEFVGRNMFDLMHPDDLKPIQSLFAELIQMPASRQSGSFRLKRSDGTWRWFEAIGTNMLEEPSVQAIVINYRDITERKQAEEALRESEARLHTIVQSEPECIKLLDLNGRLLDMNPAGLKMIEADSLEQVQGVSIFKIVAPSYRAAFKTLNARVFKGESGTLEFEIIGLKGARRWLETHAVPFRNAQGEVTSLLGITRDITERKQAEITIRESEDRYRDLVENSQDLICTHNLEGLILTANLASARILGYELDELIGRNLRDFLIPEVKDHFKYYLSKLRRHGSANGLLLVQTKSGERRIWEYQNTVRSEGVAEPVVRGMARDITERKRSEEALNKTRSDYQRLFNHANDVILIFEAEEEIILDVNAAACAIYGFSRDELIGMSLKKLTLNVTQGEAQIRDTLENRSYRDFESIHINKNGQKIYFLINASVVEYQNKEAILSINHDITERKQAEEVVRDSESRYRSLFEDSPIALWEEDFSAVKQRIEALREQGVINFQEYFTTHRQDVIECAALVKVLDINNAALKLYGANIKDDLLSGIAESIKDEPIQQFQHELVNIAEGRISFGWEGIIKKMDGSLRNIDLSWHAVRDHENSLSRVIVSMIDITERKHSEEALHESEERFHSLFHRMMDGVYRSKHEGKFVDVNPAMVKMFGYSSKEEILAVDIKNELYFEPEERGSHILDTGQEEMDVYRMRRKDGSEIWVEDHGSYVHDEQGNIIYHEGILRDITDRKRADQALAESEARFRQAVAAADAIPYSLNYASDHYTFIGSGITKLAGYSAEEMTPALLDSLIVESIMHGNFEGVPLDDAVKLVREGNSGIFWRCDHRIRTRSGEERWISDSSVQVLGENNIPTGSIGIIQDITERKQAEETLRRAEEQYRTLVEQLPAIVFIDDAKDEGRTLYISPQTKTILGFTPQQWQEESPGLWSKQVHPDDLERVHDGYMRCFQYGEPYNAEYRISASDGRLLWFRDQAIMLRDENGKPNLIHGVMYDITERKQAEEALQKAEIKYRMLVERLPVIIYTSELGRNGAWPYVSPQIEELLGFTAQEWMADPELWYRQVHADDRDRQQKLEEQAWARQESFEGEYRIFTRDGRQIWIRDSAQILPPQNNGVPIIQGILMDITERKRAEESLRESEQRYRALFENMPVAIWEEDFSDVKKHLDSLKEQGVTDFRSYFESYPDVATDWFNEIRILDVNNTAVEMFRAENKEQLIRDTNQGTSKGELEHVPEFLMNIADGKTSDSWEGVDETAMGEPIEVSLSWSVVPGHEVDFSRVIVTTIDITKRKQAEEDLRESEQRYRALFEDIPVSIWEEDFSEAKQYLDALKEQGVTDLRTYFKHKPEAFLECATMIRILDVNQATLKMYHAGSKEDLYKRMDEGLSESEVEHLLDALIAISEGKISHSWEGVDETVTGESIDISLNWTVAPGYEADFSRVIVTTMDITERKRADEALQKSEKRFRALIANTGDLIVLIDPQGIIQFASPSSQRILGYEPAETIGINFTDWVHPDDLAEVLNSLATRLREPGTAIEGIRARGRHKNGSWRILDTIGTNLIDEPAIQGIVLNIRDVTERELAEEALRASEAQFRAIFEGAAIGIALVDPTGHPVKVNSALEEMLGYEAQELRRMAFTDLTHADDITTDRELWQELISGKRESYQLEKRFIHKDKHVIWVKLTSSIVPGASGEILFGVGMVEDISERKKAEAENKYQLSELEALYENGLAISKLLEPKQIAQRMVEVMDQKLQWHHAAIRTYDTFTDRLELLAISFPGFDEAQTASQIERINQTINTPDKGLSGWVIRHGEVVRIGKLKDDPRYIETYENINSGLYVPIKSGGRVIGSIAVESEQENAFTERDEATLNTLANQAAISFINARLYTWLKKELDERLKAEEEILKLNLELEQRVSERTAQIEATKRRLELATHAGQIGVWEYIPRENKVIWDDRMHMIHQMTSGQFDGTSEAWGRIMHPDDLEQLPINRQLAFTKNLLMNNEHRIIWPDGSVHHIMASAVMTYSPEGTPERIIGINMDITDRKQIETSLRESENYARLLFDAVPDPVSVTDADGLIVDVNKEFEKQFSAARDESRGKRIRELGIYPESEIEKRDEYVDDVLQGRAVKPVELDFYVPGDRIHTLELHSYLLKVNGRRLMLNTSHDITAHKKAEEAQRIAKAEMERALRIKNEFLANMSHELRTPLNSILGISESLEEQVAGTLNEKQLKYIGIVRESGRHLLELINDILDLSKIEAGRMELDIHRISVETLCQSSLRMVKELSQKKSLHVSYKVHGDIKIIQADQRRLKQSLVNLLSNAVKFTPKGKEIGLEVKGSPGTNEIEFTVWDQGVGIAPEDMKLLFKPFVQLDAGLAREYQGTGLGLALVAQMINLHGGHVSVESEIGKGSRFTITLPWAPDEQAPKAKVTAELSLPGPRSTEKRNGRILLVEDTDVVVQLISEYLRYKGYEIILAQNGVEGIRLAAQERPDLILMDVMMPIMDGLEATRQIRADADTKNIPIIALTALAMTGDSEKCLAAGMNDYLSKPIQMQDLADMIEKYTQTTLKESDEK